MEEALEEQKVKGRRMIIEEIGDCDSDYDTPPENGISGHDATEDSDVGISGIEVRETKHKASEVQDIKSTSKAAATPRGKKSKAQKVTEIKQDTEQSKIKTEAKPKQDSKPRKQDSKPANVTSGKTGAKAAQKNSKNLEDKQKSTKSELKPNEASTAEERSAEKTSRLLKPESTNTTSDQAETDKSSSTHPGILSQGAEPERPKTSPPLPTDVADLKEEGNQLFKNGQYGDAIEKYSQAVKQLQKGTCLLFTIDSMFYSLQFSSFLFFVFLISFRNIIIYTLQSHNTIPAIPQVKSPGLEFEYS